jgi:hypothetical protein
MKSLSVVVCTAALLAAPSLAAAGPMVYIDPDRVGGEYHNLAKAFYATTLTVYDEYCPFPDSQFVASIRATEGIPWGASDSTTPLVASTGELVIGMLTCYTYPSEPDSMWSELSSAELLDSR